MRANRHAAQWMVFALGLGAMGWAGQAFALTGQPLAYVTTSNGIAVIDTGDNQVVDTIVGPSLPAAVTPDGKEVYAFAPSSSDLVFNISVINATTDQLLTTIPLVTGTVTQSISIGPTVNLPAFTQVAITPNGKYVYVTSQAVNNVTVIDTASNTVTATVLVSAPGAISILPPPQGVQFPSFNARLKIHLSPKPNDDTFELESSFTLNGSANDAIQLDKVPVKLQVGSFIGTFPIGSFKPHGDRSYTFVGVINGAQLHATVERTGVRRYRFRTDAKDTNLSGITNPVQTSLSVGDNAGLTSVKARY